MSILILAVAVFSIGYLTSQTTTVERTSTMYTVVAATSSSTLLYSYQSGSMVHGFMTETGVSYHAYSVDTAACYSYVDDDPTSPDFGSVYTYCPTYYDYLVTYTTTHPGMVLVVTQATGTQVITNAVYHTHSWLIGWVDTVPYLASVQGSPIIFTIVLSLIVAAPVIAALIIVARKKRGYEKIEPGTETEPDEYQAG
jgi:hypothetical protein